MNIICNLITSTFIKTRVTFFEVSATAYVYCSKLEMLTNISYLLLSLCLGKIYLPNFFKHVN